MPDVVYEILPVIIVVIAAVVSVVSAISKKVKTNKSKGSKTPPSAGKKPTIKEDAVSQRATEATPDEQFEVVMKKMEAQKSASNAHRDEKRREKNKKQSDRFRYDTRKNVQTVDDTGGKVITETNPKEKTVEGPHSHPAMKNDKNSKVKVEKKPSSAGSLGEDNDEGCDHGDVRYIIDDVVSQDGDSAQDIQELQRLIVWRDILGRPKSKQKYTK